MENEIKILIADDHLIVRDGLEALLSQIKDFRVIAKASSGVEAIEFYKKSKPDIVLMDIKMPFLDGISSMKKIIEEDKEAKVIILTTYFGDEDIYKSFKEGAKGYILKDVPLEELEKVIRIVYKGEKYITQDQSIAIAKMIDQKELTKRELEILKYLSEGKSNKEISKILNISISTTKAHISKIFEKIGATSRTEAISKAIKKGILHP